MNVLRYLKSIVKNIGNYFSSKPNHLVSCHNICDNSETMEEKVKVQVLHDSDNIYKTYYNVVTKQYVEANSSKYSGLPYIQEQCFPNQNSAVAALARMRYQAEIIEGGYKESETSVEPVSDEELRSQLSKLSVEAGVNIPDEVLNPPPPRARVQKVNPEEVHEFEMTYPDDNTNVASQPTLGRTATQTVFESKSFSWQGATSEYMKVCAKLSVAKKKVEKDLLLAWINGFEAAATPEAKVELHKIKEGFIND